MSRLRLPAMESPINATFSALKGLHNAFRVLAYALPRVRTTHGARRDSCFHHGQNAVGIVGA